MMVDFSIKCQMGSFVSPLYKGYVKKDKHTRVYLTFYPNFLIQKIDIVVFFIYITIECLY